MKRLAWPTIAIAAVFALGAATALAITGHAEQRAIIRAQAATSAATSITLFLVAIIALPVIGAVGALALAAWLRGREKRARLEDALSAAQIYGALQGRPATPRRRAMPRQSTAGGNILVFPSGQPTPQVTIGDEWEVLE
jgi:hypothetical protein